MSNSYRDNDEPAYTVAEKNRKRGRRSKNKGKAGEREAAKEVSRVLGCKCRRGVQYSGGGDSPDIVTSIKGIHWEVKRVESLSLYKALEQANKDKKEEDVGVVLHRRNNRKWVVIVELDNLPKLLEAITDEQNRN